MDEEFKLNTVLPNGVTLLTSNEEYADSYVTEFWTSEGGRSSVVCTNTNTFSATVTHRAIVKVVKAVTKEE